MFDYLRIPWSKVSKERSFQKKRLLRSNHESPKKILGISWSIDLGIWKGTWNWFPSSISGEHRNGTGGNIKRMDRAYTCGVYIYIMQEKLEYEIEKHNHRRKFRSQTSDNMERWKAEQGRGREKRKIRRKKSRRERVRRRKTQMREKVGRSRNTVFFQWFVAPEGRKVGSLKRRVRSQLPRWEMKNCTPLWREAHLQVKMYKTHQLRTTFGN